MLMTENVSMHTNATYLQPFPKKCLFNFIYIY